MEQRKQILGMLLKTHAVSTYEAAKLHPRAQQEQGTQNTAVHLSIIATDGLIGLLHRGKECHKLCRFNNLLEMLNPS